MPFVSVVRMAASARSTASMSTVGSARRRLSNSRSRSLAISADSLGVSPSRTPRKRCRARPWVSRSRSSPRFSPMRTSRSPRRSTSAPSTSASASVTFASSFELASIRCFSAASSAIRLTVASQSSSDQSANTCSWSSDVRRSSTSRRATARAARSSSMRVTCCCRCCASSMRSCTFSSLLQPST